MRKLLYALPLLFGLVFFGWPLAAILQRALAPDGELALQAIADTLTAATTWRVVGFTAWQAGWSTLLTIVLATPAAWLFTHYEVPASKLLHSLAAVPFVLPTIVVALAFGALFNENGLLNRGLMQWFNLATPPIRIEDSLSLVLLSHIFFNYTIVLRIVGGYWRSADPQLEAAARMLGASPWRVWWEIRLPLVGPALLAAALLVFTFTFAAFGTILILGGQTMRSVEIEIYDLAVNRFNLPAAAVLSLLQIATTLGLTLLYTRLQQRAAVPQSVRPLQRQKLHSWPLRLGAGLIILSMILMFLAPLGALVLGAVRVDGRWSFHFFELLSIDQRGSYFFVPPGSAMFNSLRFATIASVLALLIGVPAAYLLARPRSRATRWLDPLFMLPLGTSAVTLGFGYILTYRSYQLPGGISTPDLRSSPWLIPFAHTLLALPFVVRTMLPALRRLNPHIGEAASILGASAWRRWREIDIPLLLPALIVSTIFAFNISLGDFGAALILSVAGPDYATMPVVIYRFLGQPGAANYGQALAMSSLLMLVTLISFGVIERFQEQQWG